MTTIPTTSIFGKLIRNPRDLAARTTEVHRPHTVISTSLWKNLLCVDTWYMTQRDDYVNALVRMAPHVYYYQGWNRCHPDRSGYTDCSGFVTWGLNQVGIPMECTGSFALARMGHAAGTGISIDEARRTKGAWLFIGINEGQGGIPGRDPGHIATSLGDGRTIEARGRYSGVGIFPWSTLASRWDWACLPPGMSGFNVPSESNNPGPSTPAEAKDMGMKAAKIIPGAHAQTRGAWKGRYPFIAAVEQQSGVTDLIGFNGASIEGGKSYLGMSIFPLGHLNASIEDLDWDPATHKVVALAGDGGSFAVIPHVHYS